jgi:hypothetical protein
MCNFGTLFGILENTCFCTNIGDLNSNCNMLFRKIFCPTQPKLQVLSLDEFHRTATAGPREPDSGSVADSESEKVSDQVRALDSL